METLDQKVSQAHRGEIRFSFTKQGSVGRFFDILFEPWMRMATGSPWELPQRTNFWNNKSLSAQSAFLKKDLMVFVRGIQGERKNGIISHIPIWGWKQYVVLAPLDLKENWHVGWMPPSALAGYSMIPIQSKVKMRIGDGDVFFFGLNEDGYQIKLAEVGRGVVGLNPEFFEIPFL